MQKTFLELIEAQCAEQANAIAIQATGLQLTYQQLWTEVLRIQAELQISGAKCIAVALPNSAAWVILDLAAALQGIRFVPVPHFFTESQRQHLINDASVDLMISISVTPSSHEVTIVCAGQALRFTEIPPAKPLHVTDKAFKISYTSGTTGSPKGVQISMAQVSKTVNAILESISPGCAERHLSVLPFSLLLENIVGIYAVLAAGGRCIIADFNELGLSGSSQVDWRKFASVVQIARPTSMITVPALLQGLMHCVTRLGMSVPSLKFIAVGGAPVSATLLAQAEQMGLPVFQGYGMTECGSVVCLNTPADNRRGSVGKPLPHVTVRIDDQGQIIIGDAHFSGYIGRPDSQRLQEWPSGDLGRIDEDGYVYVTARQHSAYSTAYGRNVAPEWVESELDSAAIIAQSSVFGAGKQHNIAVIVPVSSDIPDSEIGSSIKQANTRLPDYARIANWVRAEQPFCVQNQQRAAAGNLCREQIYLAYQHRIEPLFSGTQA